MRTADEERAHWNAVDPVEDYERCIFDGPAEHGLVQIMDAWPPDATKVLDLGCGTGRLTIPLARVSAATLWGVDISRPMVDAAIRAAGGIAWFCRGDGRSIPLADGFVDFAYSMLLFQHLEPETVAGYLREMARVLRPGGRFVFQFAYDPDGSEGPYAFNHAPIAVAAWCDDAGLPRVVPWGGISGYRDDLYPTWRWLAVEKPA